MAICCAMILLTLCENEEETVPVSELALTIRNFF